MMIRRKFVRNVGLLTSGMLFQSTIMKAFAGKDRRINLGIIGCGDRGVGIMHVLARFPQEYKIIGVCDELAFRLEEATKNATNSDIKTYKDYNNLLNNSSIDAVVIAVPLNMHFPIAKAAMEAGKHVYLEKTMTYNITQALELVNIASKKPKQVLQVGHQYRYTPLYNKVKEMITEGYLGKVTQIDCRWDRNASWRRPLPDPSLERKINWRMYKEYSGGLMAELLSHQIDFINWAFNTHPDELFATGGIDFYKDGRETYDNVQATLRYNKAGMIGNFGATCGNAHDGYLFKIKGTKGMISLLVDKGMYYPEKNTLKQLQTVDGVTGATKIEFNKDGGIPILDEKMKDGTWYALEDFYKCIIAGKVPDSNVRTGSTTAICVHLANQALYDKTIQYWKPEFS